MKTTYKKIIVFLLLLAFLTPLAVLAQTDMIKNLDNAAGPLKTTNPDLPALVGQIIKIFLGFLGVIFVILIIYAGFMWMTAGGDDDKVKTAKNLIIRAIIGIGIIFIAYVITAFVIDSLKTATGVNI